MNQNPLKKNIDGVLEILITEKLCLKKTHTIYASKINDNGTWEYYRKNGQNLAKKSSLNPEQMALALGREYSKRNMKGEIHWRYLLK